MIALTGTYHNGQLKLDDPITFKKPIKVIVTFLEEDLKIEPKKNMKGKFSFEKSRKLLENYKGSFAETVVEERNEER